MYKRQALDAQEDKIDRFHVGGIVRHVERSHGEIPIGAEDLNAMIAQMLNGAFPHHEGDLTASVGKFRSEVAAHPARTDHKTLHGSPFYDGRCPELRRCVFRTALEFTGAEPRLPAYREHSEHDP